MKGQLKIYWVIGVVAIVVITVTIFLEEFKHIATDVLNLVARTSSEVVCRQLSNLITVSGAAPYGIEINYVIGEATFDATIEARMLTIKPKFKAGYLVKLSASHPFAVELHDISYQDVNSFKIAKKIVKGEAIYGFYATKA